MTGPSPKFRFSLSTNKPSAMFWGSLFSVYDLVQGFQLVIDSLEAIRPQNVSFLSNKPLGSPSTMDPYCENSFISISTKLSLP